MTLFVYGTLRTGGALQPHYPLAGTRHPATLANYRLHYVDSLGGYPVVVPHAGERVVGEVIYDPNPFVLRRVIEMEERVGYRIETLYVRDEQDPAGVLTEAMVCTWPYRPGPPVLTGDWLRREVPQ